MYKRQARSCRARYDSKPGVGVFATAIGDDDVASLRARLASSEAELERVRRASRDQIESMEKEVELYFEMAEEMKRTMRVDGVC